MDADSLTDNPASSTPVAFATTQDREEAYKRAESRAGKCPMCNRSHTYKQVEGNSMLDWPSHQLDTCPRFSALTPIDKGKKVD